MALTSNSLTTSAAQQLPNFSHLRTEDFTPNIQQLIQQNEQLLTQLLADKNNITWQQLEEPLTAAEMVLSNAWCIVSHLNAVCSTPTLRETHDNCLLLLTNYYTQLHQNSELFEAYQKIQNNPTFNQLNDAQKKVIKNSLRDFKLAGVALSADKKIKYQAISQRLSQIESEFEHHVMDATDNWHYLITDEKELTGIPQQHIQQFAKAAQEHQQSGWRISLDYPSYHAVITYADSDNLRYTMYKAYTTRASEMAENTSWDNSKLMVEILQLRQEMAQLLDYKNYVDYALVTRMAHTSDEVRQFLQQLVDKLKPIAKRDWQTLSDFAANQGKVKLEPWDLAYYSEKLRVTTFNFSEDELRNYFPADKVLPGLFLVISKIFDIKIIEKNNNEVWNKSVKYYIIENNDGKTIGHLYCDIFPRAQKRGGAWMSDCRSRYIWPDENKQLPVAFVTANLTPPSDNKPALLSHDEVTTLFHEFGHALHHLLTRIDYPSINGINAVAWDVVELPSQWLEQWCWQKEALPLISQHVTTGEPLPDELLKKALAAKNFQAALGLLRQLEFALFDLTIHEQAANVKTPEDITRLLQEIRSTISVLPIAPFNRFQHSFSHIFAGGYAAGYYSYLWAEVFENAGIFDKATGKRFLDCFLSQGGSKDADVLVKDFLGREPNNQAFLKYHGVK